LENIKNKNLNNLLNYTQSIEIVSYDKITNYNQYSFVNENFCRNLKIKYEKRDIACYFVNKKERFVYFFNQKKLLKVINYNDNTFYLLIPKPPIPKILPRSNGLENIGATCYMNATLQCLSNVTSLRDYFLDKNKIQKDAEGRPTPMAESFYELIKNSWKIEQKYYAPYKFKDLISQMNPLFRGIQANDSKDLIIFIYETLHKELNNPSSNNIKLTNINDCNDMHEELKELRQNYYSKNKSIITKIFYSEIMNNIQCCTCKFNKASFNIISFLIFPLEKVRLYLEKKKPLGFPSVTLEDCFEQNEEKETFTGSNQIYCNNCFNNSDALSYNRLYNCPEVLTIILNRGKGLEFNVEFEFPYNINIEKYVIDKSCNTNYELIGVITHLGPSGMSGHFIAYCKSPSDKNWYRYNDSQVTPCVDAKSEINSNGIPYVLYYQRCNREKEKVVEEDPSDNFLDTNTITLYFTYNDKEVYLDLNKNQYFFQVKEELCKKFKWIPPETNDYYIMKQNQMKNIEMDKTIEENSLKNGDKICIV
jgi:ubiquitin carboxyl-terminal hydrolase 2/21